MSILQQMQPNMILQHFGHQTVNSAAHGCQKHQYLRAVMILNSKLSLDRFHLPADSFHPVLQFRPLPINMRHFHLRLIP